MHALLCQVFDIVAHFDYYKLPVEIVVLSTAKVETIERSRNKAKVGDAVVVTFCGPCQCIDQGRSRGHDPDGDRDRDYDLDLSSIATATATTTSTTTLTSTATVFLTLTVTSARP